MTPLGTNTQISKQSNDKIPVNKQNGTAGVFARRVELKGKVYKLMIQIDKIKAKPGPRCKKQELLAASRREKFGKIRQVLGKQVINDKIEVKKEETKPDDTNVQVNSEIQNLLGDDRRSQCPVCQEYVESLLALLTHHRTAHSVCQLCEAPFVSQVVCDKHETLHQSNDSLLVYKCHLCNKTYDCDSNLKTHVKVTHWSAIDQGNSLESDDVKVLLENLQFECGICKLELKDEELYRNHMVLHQIVNVENPLLKHPEKISEIQLSDQQNLKYTCTICTQTFYTPSAAEAHTCQTTAKPENEKKVCNVCQKIFDNDEILNQHLANHLSRAHHCTVCRKAFVNRITLKNHMKTHGL